MMTPSSWQGLTRFAVSTGCAVPVVSASLASGVELVGPGPGIRVINFVVDRNLSCARTAETALPDLEGILARCLQFSLSPDELAHTTDACNACSGPSRESSNVSCSLGCARLV